MKKNHLIILSLFAGLLLFVFAFWQVNWSELSEVLFLFPKKALVIIALINFLAIFIIGSYRWQLILKSQGCIMGFWSVVRAKLSGFTFSYVTPSMLIAGEPIRAYMIKEESDCGWERSSASVIIDQVIYLATLFLMVIFGFFLLTQKFVIPGDVLYGFWLVFLLAVWISYIFYKRMFMRKEGESAFFTYLIIKTGFDRIKYIKRKLPAIERTECMIEEFFRGDKRAFLLVVFLAFVEIFMNALAVVVTCFFIGHWVGFENSIGVFSLWALANLAPIPGSLGSSELALAFVFELLGAGRDTGLVFSLIFRAINIVFCLSGVLAFIYFAIKTVSHKFSTEAPPILLKLHGFIAKIKK